MYCGIMLTGDTDEASAVAFLDDAVETHSVAEDEALMKLLEEHRPDIIVLNAPPDRATTREFRSGEEELVEEGHNVLPQGMRDTQLLERAAYITRSVERSGIGARVLESDPEVVGRELGVATDADMADYGIDPADVHTRREFEAVLLAVAARLYDEDAYQEKDLIVPEGTVPEDDD